MRDVDGNEWQAFEDEFQRRRLRCVAGPRAGDIVDNPDAGDARLWLSKPARVDRRSDFERALDESPFDD